MEKFEQVNVKEMPSATRHQIIINKIHQLKPKEGLVIKVDHDPKPLYFMITEVHKIKIKWEYIQKGPTLWEVLIIRESALEDMKLEDLISGDLMRLNYFLRIDPKYSMDQSGTVKEVAMEHYLDPVLMIREVQNINQTYQPHFDYWGEDFFSQFIQQNFIPFERVLIEQIRETQEKVLYHHASEQPALRNIETCFNRLNNEVKPFLNNHGKLNGISTQEKKWYFQIISHLRELKRVSSEFNPPNGACPMTQYYYNGLEKLYFNFLFHIYFEVQYTSGFLLKN